MVMPMPRIDWRRIGAHTPLTLALTGVLAVWLCGAVWSFAEQTDLARLKGFDIPQLLPLTFDGLALSLAGVAFAAALDARPAISARIGTAVAIAASAASNAAAAWDRSDTATGQPDWLTVALATTVPIWANLALEVFLSELRRRVQRRRGLPPPVAIPWPRVIRLVLAPVAAGREWRTQVLALTAPVPVPAGPAPSAPVPAVGRPDAPEVQRVEPVRTPVPVAQPHPAPALPATPEPAPAPEVRAAPGDEQILATIRDMPAIPSIRTLKSQFSIGQTKASEIQRAARAERLSTTTEEPEQTQREEIQEQQNEELLEHTPMQVFEIGLPSSAGRGV
jgi:Protein of unknown function (DUF2637)